MIVNIVWILLALSEILFPLSSSLFHALRQQGRHERAGRSQPGTRLCIGGIRVKTGSNRKNISSLCSPIFFFTHADFFVLFPPMQSLVSCQEDVKVKGTQKEGRFLPILLSQTQLSQSLEKPTSVVVEYPSNTFLITLSVSQLQHESPDLQCRSPNVPNKINF